MTAVPPGGKIVYINGKKVILDKDGKPCRQCNSLADFKMANIFQKADSTRSDSFKTAAASAAAAGVAGVAGAASATDGETFAVPTDCPPDSQQLGRSTWTFLHTMAANYPEKPSFSEQVEMVSFLNTFSKVYPCWWCAKDFRVWIAEEKNKPQVASREDLSLWLCDAHNAVNTKLGKPTFKCSEWKYRWKNGWPDGRCD